MEFTVYDVAGRVLRTGECPAEMVDIQALEGEFVVAAYANFKTQYISNSEVVDRPSNPTALIDNTLSSIPLPSTLTINGESFEITEEDSPDGTVELDLTEIGSYKITVEAWPYLPISFDISI